MFLQIIVSLQLPSEKPEEIPFSHKLKCFNFINFFLQILTINGKTPRNVDDAVGVIKQAGNQIKLVVLRAEDVPGNPDITIEEQERQSVGSGGEIDSRWVGHP